MRPPISRIPGILTAALFAALLPACGSDQADTDGSAPGAVAPASPTPAPDPSATPSLPSQPIIQNGVWGGSTSALNLTETGGTFREKEQCITGTLDQPLSADATGAFSVPGTVQKSDDGSQNPTYQAEYSGNVRGESMSLSVTYDDGSGQPREIRDELTHGFEGPLPGPCD